MTDRRKIREAKTFERASPRRSNFSFYALLLFLTEGRIDPIYLHLRFSGLFDLNISDVYYILYYRVFLKEMLIFREMTVSGI